MKYALRSIIIYSNDMIGIFSYIPYLHNKISSFETDLCNDRSYFFARLLKIHSKQEETVAI